jgi:glycosyltransferase involved in cell wall biosynthesis
MISVIIPVYNNNNELQLTLEAFSKQSLDEDLYEIFIVDDGSPEKAENVVNSFKGKIKNIKYIYQKNGGRSRARNGARKYLNGTIVLFNDADRIPNSTFLEMHYKFHQAYKNCVCVGEVKEIYFTDILNKKDRIFKVVDTDNRMAKKIPVHKVLYSIYDDNGFTTSKVPWITTFSGNLSIPRSILDNEVGWFDESFSEWGFEHFELGFRLFKAGATFAYNNKAKNYHIAHSRESGSLFTAMKLSHQYFLKKHPEKSVEYLMDFMLGEISLQKFEAIAANHSIPSNIEHSFIKIIN